MNDNERSIHSIHDHQSHLGWNNAILPVISIAPGETVEFHPLDASGGQLTKHSTVGDIARLDFSKVNPVTGPVFVEGAESGDALKVTLLSFAPSGWGWTANIPGLGLLADQFTEPALHIWSYDAKSLASAMYGPGGKVPLRPFCGTIGLAPAEPGPHSIVPPRRVGGNKDIRDMGAGTELYLPVEAPGPLFSVGDTNAAQATARSAGPPSRARRRSPRASISSSARICASLASRRRGPRGGIRTARATRSRWASAPI